MALNPAEMILDCTSRCLVISRFTVPRARLLPRCLAAWPLTRDAIYSAMDFALGVKVQTRDRVQTTRLKPRASVPRSRFHGVARHGMRSIRAVKAFPSRNSCWNILGCGVRNAVLVSEALKIQCG